jgi:hypothetical protein
MTRGPGRHPAGTGFDPAKFENVHQLGGIRTGSLDAPGAGGAAGVRVALVDTGAGLRFTVALDRGGDIVDATYNEVGLAYLSPNGLRPPNPAYHQGMEWLRGWAGGLLTTCGPEYIGGPRVEAGGPTSLHGRFSNCPAALEAVRNPDPRRGRMEMELDLLVRDTRVFGPAYEIRRSLRCTLGQPEIVLEDEVTNCGDTPSAHHWLYHCNLGYPLLDEGTRFVYRGRAEYWEVPPPEGQDIVQPRSSAAMNRLKRVPPALPGHAGGGERGLIVAVPPDRDGMCRAGAINDRLKLGVRFAYPAAALPRMAHWQHYGPRGSYATALEPFHGSLLGRARDRDPSAESMLEPGESRKYSLRIRILTTPAELRAMAAHDGPVQPWR